MLQYQGVLSSIAVTYIPYIYMTFLDACITWEKKCIPMFSNIHAVVLLAFLFH